MDNAARISRHPLGRTFTISFAILAAIAAIQTVVFLWLLKKSDVVAAKRAQAIAAAAPAAPHASEEKLEGTDPLTAPEKSEAAGKLAASEPAPSPTPVIPVASPTPVQLARPTPVPAEEREVGVRAILAELLDQARAYRSRGDSVNAVTRLREADRMNPGNPETISELAYTYEKMGLQDKAMQEWRRIYDMGEDAGPLYSAAQAKLSPQSGTPTSAPLQGVAPTESPASGGPPAEALPGIDAGKMFGILDITSTDQTDAQSEKKMLLKVPIKKRAGLDVDVRDVAIQVLLYDMLEDGSVVQTSANINSHWTTIPADWSDDDIEILEVEYQQPRRPGERRTYYGYVVRVYYKKELQAWRGEPAKLKAKFPAPPTLQTDDQKPR